MCLVNGLQTLFGNYYQKLKKLLCKFKCTHIYHLNSCFFFSFKLTLFMDKKSLTLTTQYCLVTATITMLRHIISHPSTRYCCYKTARLLENLFKLNNFDHDIPCHAVLNTLFPVNSWFLLGNIASLLLLLPRSAISFSILLHVISVTASRIPANHINISNFYHGHAGGKAHIRFFLIIFGFCSKCYWLHSES